MNIDNDMNPQSKKSSPLKWILGGCAVLALLGAICIGGGVYFSWGVIGDAFKFQQEIQGLVESSSEVGETLGNPFQVNGINVSKGADGLVVYEFDVSGPKGEGIAHVEAKMNPSSLKLERQGMHLEFNGEKINLDPEAELDLGIEGLDEEF